MSRVVVIQDARGLRRVDESVFPLRIGGSEVGDVVIPGVAPDTIVATIALSRGHAFVQPEDAATAVFHNHDRVTESVWLKSGDRVEAGEGALEWTVKGDQLFIRAGARDDASPLTPPATPPPAPPTPENPLPVPAAVTASGRRRGWRVLAASVFAVLLLAAGFVLFAVALTVEITPPADTRRLSATPPPIPLAGRLLVWPGVLRVQAEREGYLALDETVDVVRGGPRHFSFTLQELPGRVQVEVDPAVAFELYVDGAARALSGGIAEIPGGSHVLEVRAPRYLSEQRRLEVEGRGRSQQLAFVLQPAWAEVTVASRPVGAELRLDGAVAGTTPATIQVIQGERRFELSLPGYKTSLREATITAGQALDLGETVLQPLDGRVRLSSEPAGATVTVNGEFHGATPVELVLTAGTAHRVQLAKAGYAAWEESIEVTADEERSRLVKLTPEYGIVFVSGRPADAELRVDGKAVGDAVRRLRLSARSHELKISRAGYVTEQITVTVRAGASQTVEFALRRQAAQAAPTPEAATAADGETLRLVRPNRVFTMGASRRDAGRRANESVRRVELTRAFYLGVNEVSNTRFRRFAPDHDSGSQDGAGLDGDTQPVVNVSWDDAARYCNWLSDQENLAPVYEERDGRLVAVSPVGTGYRLPSEAEWAYVARMLAAGAPARYPWSGSFPPAGVAGNYADARIADTLADVVPNYDDGYRGSAPVGSFPAFPDAFFDLGDVARDRPVRIPR